MAYNSYGLNDQEQQNLKSGGLLPGYSQMDVQKARTTTQRQQPRVDAYTGAARVPRQRMQDVPIDGRTGAARKMPAATGLPKPQANQTMFGESFVPSMTRHYSKIKGLMDLANAPKKAYQEAGGGIYGGGAATGAYLRNLPGAVLSQFSPPDAPVAPGSRSFAGGFLDAITGNTQPPPTDANFGAGAMGPQASGPGAPPQESYTLQTPVSRGLGAIPDMSAADFSRAGIGPQPLENAAYGQGAPGITRMVQGGQTRYDTPQGYADFQGTPGAAARRLGLPQGGGFSVVSGRSPEMQAAVDRNVAGIEAQIAALQAQRGTPRPIDERVNVVGDGGGFGLLSNEHEAMRRAQMDAAGLPTKRRADYLQAVLPGHLAATGAKPPADPRVGLDLARLQQDQAEFQAGLAADQTKQQQAAAQQDFENRLALQQFGLSREQAEFGQQRDVANLNRGLAKDRMEAAKESYGGMLRQGLMERLQDPLANEETVSAYLNSSLGAISKMMGEPVYMYQGNIVSQSDIADTAKREDIKARAKQAGIKPEEFVMNLLREQGLYSPSAAPAQ